MVQNPGEESNFRPRLVLRFGLTGHRPPRLDAANHEVIKRDCAQLFVLAQEVLESIQSANVDVFAPTPAGAKLITSMAEGADVLGTEAALGCGLHISACIPFPLTVYAKDFGKEEWQRSASLIEKSDSVMALDDFAEDDVHAYEAAGRVVLDQSDILVAIWDGGAARGRGGTAQIVAEAVARHQPVIFIDATGERSPELLWSGLNSTIPDQPSVEGVERADAIKSLPALITALCAPPQGSDLRSLHDFMNYRESDAKRSFAWPMLLGLTGAKPWSKISFAPGNEEQAANFARNLSGPFAEFTQFGKFLNGNLINRYGRADAKANSDALRFRSSFVANFTMAGFAVLLALSGLLFSEGKTFFIIAELFLILLIIANTRSANRNSLHQRWIDCRHLAEKSRFLSPTATLGCLSLRAVEDGTRHPGWVGWYARASARELGLVSTTVDGAYLAKVRNAMLEMISDQATYHRSNTDAMHHATHRLHSVGDSLFIGTIIACAAYLIILIISGKDTAIFGIGISELVTFFTALFPALAAALYGIRMQGDFAATAERSTNITAKLNQLHHAINGDPLRYTRLVERSRRLSEVMLFDMRQWHLQYETRPLNLPG